MDLVWQNLAVLLVVAVAGGYLARAAWQTLARKKAAACGGCGTCSNPASEPKIVTLDTLSQSAKAVAASAAVGNDQSV
jgi:hypothetical protein